MKHSIAIIDDDLMMLNLLESFLQSDYNIITYESSETALDEIGSKNKPDLIICDVKMPRISGQELLEQFKSNYITEHTPVLMLSSVDKSGKRIECLSAGAEDFIIKPFNPVELSIKIKKHLKPLRKSYEYSKPA